MNYEILKYGISKSAAFAWHAIRDGYASVCAIRERVRLKARQVQNVVKELLDKDLIIRIGYGCYKVRENALGEQEIALETRKTAQLESNSAKKCTLDADLEGAKKCTPSAKKRTGSAVNCIVRGLKKGRSKARNPKKIKPVPDEVVERTIPFMSPIVADMTRVLPAIDADLNVEREPGLNAGVHQTKNRMNFVMINMLAFPISCDEFKFFYVFVSKNLKGTTGFNTGQHGDQAFGDAIRFGERTNVIFFSQGR